MQCDTEKIYPPNGSSKYDLLQAICSIMSFIYLCVIAFNLHNVVLYLIMQKRYKTWLITIFYLLSNVVLVSRITYYILCIVYYTYLDNGGAVIENEQSAEYLRKILFARVIALYAKIALGFFQLALVLQLALLLTKNIKLKQEVERVIEHKRQEFARSLLEMNVRETREDDVTILSILDIKNDSPRERL